jgi:hypothetical protein
MEAALGAKFENLFQKMLPHVKYFVFFATISTSCIQQQQQQKSSLEDSHPGFLRIGKSLSTDGTKKIAVPFRVCNLNCFSFQKVCRSASCELASECGLCENEECETCRGENSLWLPVQNTLHHHGRLRQQQQRQGSKKEPA